MAQRLASVSDYEISHIDYETFDQIYQDNPDTFSKILTYNQDGITFNVGQKEPQQEPKGTGAMERAAKHAATLNK